MPKYAFFEGKIVPIEEAKVSVMTHALNYGTGCFEGIRAYWNADDEQLYVFRLTEHYERMHRSCRILRIDLPYTRGRTGRASPWNCCARRATGRMPTSGRWPTRRTRSSACGCTT